MKITASSYRRLPEALWRRLRKLLPKPRPHPRGGRPPLDSRRVADGIYYVMRTACPWKAAPREYGSGSSLHRYFQAWCKHGVFAKLWRMGLLEYDRRRGIGWRWQTLDTTITKAPLGGEKTGKNPTDRGKLGVKRSVLTDVRGVVLGLAVGPANRHDLRLALPTLDSLPIHRPQPAKRRPQHLCADKAYDAADFRRRLERRHYTWHIKSRGDETRDKRRHSRNKPRRWVNERTQSWFHRFHRMMIRWEKKADNYFNELEFAAAWIAFRAAGVLG